MSHSRQPTTTAWVVLKTPGTALHVVKKHVLVIFLSLASSGVHLRSFGRLIFSTVGPLDAWRAWLCQLFAKELFCSRIETQQATARDKFKIRSRPTLTHLTSRAYLQFFGSFVTRPLRWTFAIHCAGESRRWPQDSSCQMAQDVVVFTLDLFGYLQQRFIQYAYDNHS